MPDSYIPGVRKGYGRNYTNSKAAADSINNYSLSSSEILVNNTTDPIISNTRGIFGIPYQFTETCDPRISSKVQLGAKYAQKIIARMPLLFMTPCRQCFMPGYDESEQEAVIGAVIEGGDGLLENIIGKNGKYYTTEFAWADYYKYVGTLCTIVAANMGLADTYIPTNNGEKQIKKINWAKDMENTRFNEYFNAQEAAVFYVDGSSISQMSESFSNSTTESSLASTINGYSDTANEIKFLLGENSALSKMMESAAESIKDGVMANISEAFSTLSGRMLSDLAGKGTSALLSGGKLVFPKLWQDSSFSRSYSFDIKLRSPDHDSLSIFLNIMVPYLHLLALVLPVSHEDYANSYNAPFLVKAYCKGLFNIDMGIITDMSVSRGAECQWNDDGLPTQMDISISIEDLYSSLFMTSLGDFSPPVGINLLKDRISVVQNTTMLDYLANLSGLNIADIELARAAKMLFKLCNPSAMVAGVTHDLYNTFDQKIAKMIQGLYMI